MAIPPLTKAFVSRSTLVGPDLLAAAIPEAWAEWAAENAATGTPACTELHWRQMGWAEAPGSPCPVDRIFEMRVLSETDRRDLSDEAMRSGTRLAALGQREAAAALIALSQDYLDGVMEVRAIGDDVPLRFMRYLAEALGGHVAFLNGDGPAA